MMDDLPPHLILDILRRLGDSADVARCRVASSTINSIYQDIRSIHLYCSSDRYAKSRSPPNNRPSITPFKAIFRGLIAELRIVESLSIGVEKPLREMRYIDVEDDQNDLHLTNEAFVSEWLPHVCDSLKSLKIADFWVQSSWRKSEVLGLISSQCYNLLELEIKNAWLSVESLNVMPKLLSLTLEYIKLDDEDLDKLNSCFPSLKDLNLVGVGGLQNPKLILIHLQTCRWTVSNAVTSIGIYAPNLSKLELNCVNPSILESNFLVVTVPVSAFSSDSLRSLYLGGTSICISATSVFSFPRLESLHLYQVDLQSQEALGYIVKGCPVLNYLKVDMHPDFQDEFSFIISSTSLKRLELDLGSGDGHLKVDASSLEYLKIVDFGYVYLNFVQNKLTSLVEADLSFYMEGVNDEYYSEADISNPRAVSALDYVQILTLSKRVILGFSFAAKSSSTMFTRLVKLKASVTSGAHYKN